MPRSYLRPTFYLPVVVLGTLTTWSSAQVDLPPLEASTRPTLERPRSWEPANRTPTQVNSRSSSRGTSKIPDPSLFDGSAFPEEERPEQAMISQFEVPGGEPPPPTRDEQGPGQQQGGGGQGPGGDGGQQPGGGGQMAGGGGQEQTPGGGGEEEGDGSLPQIAESQMGDPNADGQEGEGGGGGQQGQPGQQGQQGQAGAQGAANAPQVATDQQGRALERPSEVQIGDEGAKLAEADTPEADPSKDLESTPGEDRMSVQAASGNQPGNRGKGTEQGVVMPSNL